MLMRLRDLRPSDDEKQAIMDVLAPIAERQATLTRRAQALLAAAGQDAPAKRWYVLTIEPGCDISVDNALANAGIERWMAAQELKAKRRGGPRYQAFCPIIKAALPGYLFMRVAWTDEAWQAVYSIDGVAGVIGGAMRPSPLKDKEVEGLRIRAEKDPEFIAKLVNALAKGDLVHVEDGPFASFEGIVTMLLAKAGRVKVDVNIFGRVVPVDLDIAQVSKSE